jgi:hypothetical protein
MEDWSGLTRKRIDVVRPRAFVPIASGTGHSQVPRRILAAERLRSDVIDFEHRVNEVTVAILTAITRHGEHVLLFEFSQHGSSGLFERLTDNA